MRKSIQTIAETAWHHEGDFDFFKDLVTQIAASNVDIIKLHITLDLEEYIDVNYNLYNILKKWTFSESQWSTIISIVKNNNKKLMLLFNDKKAVDFGFAFDPDLIEVHSVCLNDIHLLEHIKNKNIKKVPLVLGVGGSTIYEIENAINLSGSENIILMHGFQNYPTQFNYVNLNKIRKFINLYPDFDHGYADHTAWNEPDNITITLFGAATGVSYIEKHVTIKYGEERCDWNSAISIKMLEELTSKIQLINKCNGDGKLELNNAEKKYSQFGPMKKAAFNNTFIKKGENLTFDKIFFKRTGDKAKLSQMEALELIGKAANCDIKPKTLLDKSFFE